MGLLITKSDVGKVRERNEDYCWSGKNDRGDILLVVCDGLGSYEGSFEASRITVESFKQEFLEITYDEKSLSNWFLNVIRIVKTKFRDEIEKHPKYKNMSTTIVLSLIIENNVHTFWIGDSRAYQISKKRIDQLTDDHNLLNYLKKVKASKRSFLEYKSDLFSVTHFIDAKIAPQEYDYIKTKLKKNDILMLCSDGLHNFVDIEDLYPELSNVKNADQAGSNVIQMAINNDSDDNITFTSFYNGK